jgi:CRP-like cAMP-binding protein
MALYEKKREFYNMTDQEKLKNIISNFPISLKKQLIPVSYKKNDRIIKEGDVVNYGYLFTSGSFDIIKTDINENNYILAKDQEAFSCCLMDIYSNHKSQCSTVIATSEIQGYKFPRKYATLLLNSDTDFTIFLITLWANIFYATNISPTNYPLYPFKYKLLKYFAIQGIDNNTIIINLSRNVLSEIIGCSKRTIFRLLKDLEINNFISIKKSDIYISQAQVNNINKYLDEWE